MIRWLAWTALAALLVGCAGRAPMAKPVAPAGAPEGPAAHAPRIAVVDLARAVRVHSRWPAVAAADRQIGAIEAKLALASDPHLSPVRVEIPKVDLTPEMQATVERMRPEFQHEVDAVNEAARQELAAYAAQVRADQQRQLETQRAALGTQLAKSIQEKRDALNKDNAQFQQQLLAEYRLPLLNLKLKIENVQQSGKGEAEKLTAQMQALTKERDEKIAVHEKANQEALQDFQREQIEKSNAELLALQADFNKEGQRLVNERAAQIAARVRTQLDAKRSEFNQRLRGQQEAIVNSARETQARVVAQAEKQVQTQVQSEMSRIRALQAELQAAQRDRARLFAVILAAVRIEAAALAQENGWDVVLTQAISAPGAVDATDELIARIRR